MAVRNGGRKFQSEYDNDRSLHLHTTDCDKMYRWAMWRMYLNGELSRAVTCRQDFNDQSVSVGNITSHYIEHPDGKKYGRQMRKSFKRDSRDVSHSDKILPDNVYLVYGLPRISLDKKAPSEVTKLHESLNELSQKEDKVTHTFDTDKHISELFDFMSVDVPKSESKLSADLDNTHSAVVDQQDECITQVEAEVDAKNMLSFANTDIVPMNGIGETKTNGTKRETKYPLVRKSLLFWETLANKRSEIIDTGKSHPKETSTTLISSDILQKQQKLLKKTTPRQRNSRDHWKTLAERKTEILQLREIDKKEGDKKESHAKSKTSHMWGFIFSKKKDLLQMKKGHNNNNDPLTKYQSNVKRKDHEVHVSYNDPVPNTFQHELAERLKRRRERLEPAESTISH